MSRTLFTALALVACDGDGSRVAPGTNVGGWSPTAPSTDCLDSGCDDSPWFDIVYVTWSAQFGFDRATQRLTSVGTPYGPVEPSIDLLLGTRRWAQSGFDSGDTSEYCLLSMPLRGSTPPGWVLASDDLWYGVTYEGDEPISTCGDEGYELDPSRWSDDPKSAIAGLEYDGLAWGAGVGELSDNAANIVATAFRPEDLPYVFGGAMSIPLLRGIDDDVYAVGYTLDELGAVTIGADGSLDSWLADDVRAVPQGVPSAWYNVVALYIYMLNP